MRRLALALGVVVLIPLDGCASTTTPAVEPTDAGTTDAGPAVILDPGLFDCTSLARPRLPRRAASTPECLRDPACKTRLVCGHRGAGGDLGRIAPEDSLAAYRAAIAMGADLVETDPRPTKDGVIVNIHDDTLDRTTTGTGKVSETSFADIRKLSLKADKFAGDFSCEKVPTLEELLETSKDRALVLIDANKTNRVEDLVRAVQKTDTLLWAVFDTDDTSKIDRALALEPRLMIQPRVKDAAGATAVLAKYKDHLPVFVEVSQTTFPAGVPEIHAGGSRVLTNAFGVDLAIRTGGKPPLYLDFFDKGADAIQCDLPEVALEAIGRKP